MGDGGGQGGSGACGLPHNDLRLDFRVDESHEGDEKDELNQEDVASVG